MFRFLVCSVMVAALAGCIVPPPHYGPHYHDWHGGYGPYHRR